MLFEENNTKLGICFTLVSCLIYYSTLKMEATYSAETSADFQRTTLRYNPEDISLHKYSADS
jgi:hypothetical protein